MSGVFTLLPVALCAVSLLATNPAVSLLLGDIGLTVTKYVLICYTYSRPQYTSFVGRTCIPEVPDLGLRVPVIMVEGLGFRFEVLNGLLGL